MSSIEEGLADALRGFVTVFTGSIGGRVLAMLGRILIIRALPPNEFGLIVLAFTVVSIVAELAVVGVPKGVARTWTKKESRGEQLDVLKTGLIVSLFVAVLAAGVVYALRGTIARVMGEPALEGLLGLFAVYVLVHPVALTVVGGLRGLKRPRGATLANNVSPNAFSLGVFVLFSTVGLAYFGAIAYWLLLPVWSLIVGAVFLYREIDLPRLVSGLPDRSTSEELVSFSWPLAIQSGITIVMTQIDVLFIGHFLDSGDVGLYKSVLPLAKITLVFLFSYVFLYLPIATEYYTEGDIGSLKRFYQTSTKWLVFVTFPLSLVFALFPSDVIRVLYQTEYLGASTTLTILSLGLFLRVVGGPNAATIQSIDRTRVDLVSGAVGLSTNLLLNVVLIPMYGITGAAVATVAGFVAYNAVEISVMYWSYSLHPFTGNMVKPLVVTGGVGIGLATVLQGRGLGLVALGAVGGLVVAVQFGAVVLTRSIDPEDRLVVDRAEAATGVDLDVVRRFIPD